MGRIYLFLKFFLNNFLKEFCQRFLFYFQEIHKLIRVKANIDGKKLYNIYYTNWTISNIELKNKNYVLTNRFKKPINLKEMIKYAKLLSFGFCFCRVDFYEINKTIYLSEITFTPFNSFFSYKKKETEIYI